MAAPANDVHPGNGQRKVSSLLKKKDEQPLVDAMSVLACEMERANDINKALREEQAKSNAVAEKTSAIVEKHYSELRADYTSLRADYVEAKTKKDQNYDAMVKRKNEEIADWKKKFTDMKSERDDLQKKMNSSWDKMFNVGLKIVEAAVLILLAAFGIKQMT